MSQAPAQPTRPRPTLDVSRLPTDALGPRSPQWWGNLLAILIESTTLALLVAAYYYIARNYEVYPPPRTTLNPPLFETEPRLGWATANVILLALSCLPMYLTDKAAREHRQTGVRLGLLLMSVIGAVSCWMRWQEFDAVHFKWDDNAYASIVWAILGMHLIYTLYGLGELAVMDAWNWTHKLDEKHVLDVTLAGGFWYWVAGTAVIVYGVIYWSPRLL
jgi:cytochrome c oxidase subunit III